MIDIINEDLCCAVCLELLSAPIRCMPCKHMFCNKCLKAWIDEQNSCCPLCRQHIHRCIQDTGNLEVF